MNTVNLNGILVGDNYPTQIIGKIGQNHNESMDNAKKLIDMCHMCNVTLVKFQNHKFGH